MIKYKRVYEPAGLSDGYRILVDRLWPRGISKQAAHIDLWLKDIAPSNELRTWFGHDPGKWSEFQRRYKVELTKQSEAVRTIRDLQDKHRTITLVYAAKDESQNNAVALAQFLS